MARKILDDSGLSWLESMAAPVHQETQRKALVVARQAPKAKAVRPTRTRTRLNQVAQRYAASVLDEDSIEPMRAKRQSTPRAADATRWGQVRADAYANYNRHSPQFQAKQQLDGAFDVMQKAGMSRQQQYVAHANGVRSIKQAEALVARRPRRR